MAFVSPSCYVLGNSTLARVLERCLTPHYINLKGPWDYSLVSSGAPTSGTVTMPRSWQSLFDNQSGTAQFRRKFHCPTNLEPHEKVILAFTGLRGAGQAILNQSEIGSFDCSGEAAQFEITQTLKPFNELIVDISFDPTTVTDAPGGLYEVVRLEIHSEV